MNLDKLKAMIKIHEGYSNAPYRCPAGHMTIGYGHNYEANPLPKDIEGYLEANGNITPAMSERLLDQDIKNAVASCQSLYPNFDTFSDNRQDALADFLYNVGIVRARGFKKARQAINDEKWDIAVLEMKDSEWIKQVGARAVEICKMIQEG